MSEEGKNLTDKSLEASTENSLYRLMYLMVRDSNISVVVHALVLIITLMQMQYFKFNQLVRNCKYSRLLLYG